MEKKEIRKLVFSKRKELDPSWLEEKSRVICEKIMGMDDYRNAEAVYVYMDCKGEVSTRLLIEDAWKCGKKVAAPRVHGEEMTYYEITSWDDLENGYYDIPEP
ncbi:MAG: 5-formyltetrahydrofolate cyclo-ligase, partial [Candidatus Choladocola sp.]|nr:5-formyltetrahydrofolate cyclo-ligase [Candidatus Choladocola sp.]